MIQKRNEDFVMNGDFQVIVRNAVAHILTGCVVPFCTYENRE